MSKVRSTIVAPFLAAALFAGPALAQAKDFYKDKTVTIVVGFGPGGGFDLYARALAHYLPNHIPGHPNVIVQNMPGAGSLVALRSIDTTQSKDGTVMVTFEPGIITESLAEPKKINLDLRKYRWIGIASPEFEVCYGYGPNGVKSWADLMHRKQFILGAPAKGSGAYIDGAMLPLIFGAPVKEVLGFQGSADVRLAIERGELDGDCGALSSIPVDWLRDNKAHPFVRLTKERPEGLTENARFIGDYATTQEQKDLLRVLLASREVGRSYVMSSSVPADRIAIMRKAFNATMKDPGYLAEMKKELNPVDPATGQQAEKIVAKMMKVSPAIIAKVKKLYE